ncbi:restriction endonuclease subunit S [Vibrio cholerae]|uniref:restriction endonuclease subunit S n=1 Tax=Vibrio cholerae TaxID=666 RepID=UPI001CA30D82|nr:restriction endonuclease subunit S [Vibrio cholerae]
MVKLKDCCTVVGGATPKRNIPEYWDSKDVPWVTPKDISKLSNKVLNDAPEYISQLGFDKCATSLLPKGAVLLTSRAPIGNVAIAGRDMCTNQGFKSLVPSDRVDSTYLYYCMLWHSSMLEALGNGATFKEVSKKIVEEFEIPLPPLDEQKRIAEILDKADAIRQKRKQAIALAGEFLRSVFLEMFGDPVTNPKGWEVKELAEVASSQLGKMLSKHAKEGINSKKYIRNANVRWREIDVSDLSEMDFTEKEINKFALLDGDLLVCEGGEVGRCAIWTGQESDCYYQKALHRVRVKPDILTPYYLQEYFYWMARKGGLLHSVSEVTFSHLTGERLKTLKVPLPPIKLQKQFEAIYGGYIETLGRLGLAARTDNDLFNALSQKAFSGQL